MDQSPNVLVIELVNQHPSNFVLDGGAEESDLPTNISAPNARKIRNRCKVKYLVKENGKELVKHRSIRYIKGCDLIDEKEQNEAGYKPSPANDVIWVLNGKMTVIESGSDIGLYRFIKAHENNVSNPDRPDGAENIFKEIDTNVDSMKLESILDTEWKILEYLGTLKKKVEENKYQYNDDAMAFLCSLFNLPPYDPKFPAESWVSLAMFAKERPTHFLNGLANQKSVIEADVNRAISKGVINIDEVRASFGVSQKKIMEFSSNLSNDEKKKKLVDFMSNPENRLYYDQLRSELHTATVNQAAVVQ